MKNYGRILLISLLVLPAVLLAQNQRVYVAEGVGTTMIETSKNYTTTTFYDSFWDFDADFKYGILYLINGDSIDNLGIRYNITRDRFEAVSNEKKGIYIVNPDVITRIRRMSEEFAHFKYYNAQNRLSKGYFNIVDDGKTKLLYRKAEKHKEGKKGAFGYSSFKSFDSDYYIKKTTEKYPVLIKRNRQSVLDNLGDEKEAIEAFVANNSLHYHKVHDLVSILTFYDRLKNQN